MRLDNAKILISDDSILARKQLKDFISKYGIIVNVKKWEKWCKSGTQTCFVFGV